MDLSKYYADICKIPLISKERETEMFKAYFDPKTSKVEKEKIKTEVIQSNLRFAFKQAKKFSKNDPSMFGEFIAAANEGLIVGFNKYDPAMGVRYLSYAGWWVNQKILKEMSDMRIVKLPIWKQQLAVKIQKLIDTNERITLEQVLDHFKNDGSNFKEKDIKELYGTRYLTYYIDDMHETEFEFDPIGENVQNNIDNTKMWQMVSSLPSPHREVIARCFGLEDGEEKSPAQISKALKIPKNNIQRIKAEGLEMLKDLYGVKKDEE